ncbi:cyclophilin-like domain-containing protein [Pelagophyceae sp. CCMP2097]|nr:cyclophilin-like domain-containing protein [Pelagophyceae sp. CCMP2097]
MAPMTAASRAPPTYTDDAAGRRAEKRGPQYDDSRGKPAPLAIAADDGEGDSLTARPLQGTAEDWQYEISPYVSGDRRPVVFFDVAVGGRALGRIEFTLHDDVAPKTAENFRALCTGERGAGAVSRRPLWYRGSRFHRVIPGFVAQGGDITRHNGAGGESIYGGAFADENFELPHARGTLSMATGGKDANTSQFFVALEASAALDGRSCAFGCVSAGWGVVEAIASLGSEQGRTRGVITVANCGQLA